MAVASGRCWIGKSPMERAKRPGSRMSHRLWERGVRPETGLQAVCGELGEAIAWVYGSTVIEQRCIFHKLRNVADKCREELKGETNKETRKLLMEQASAIYQAESAEEARQRLATFANTWRARTPKTVATLERDFEQTIAYWSGTRAYSHHLALGAHQPGVAAQVSSGVWLWQSHRCGGGHLYPGQTTQCSLVEANVVGNRSLTLFRLPQSRPLAKDTLLLPYSAKLRNALSFV